MVPVVEVRRVRQAVRWSGLCHADGSACVAWRSPSPQPPPCPSPCPLPALPLLPAPPALLQVEHIEQVVSAWTGVPVERMDQDDKDRLLTLPHVLKVGWVRAWVGGFGHEGGLSNAALCLVCCPIIQEQHLISSNI